MLALILGESGTGKSYSTRNLKPEETYYISSTNKGLPFGGWRKKYNREKSNYFTTKKADSVLKTMKHINDNQPEIKTIILDDFQYFLVHIFMSQPKGLKGNAVFQIYNDIGRVAWDILGFADNTRDDLMVFVMAHTSVDDSGKTRLKTVGKLVDNMVTPEGICNVVLGTKVQRSEKETKYYFETQNDGYSTLKSPDGMFDSLYIPNDLQLVREAIHKYEYGE